MMVNRSGFTRTTIEGAWSMGAADRYRITDFDLPANVSPRTSGTTFFQYDAANRRVSKTSPDEQTIYIGGVYERRESVNGMVHIFHVAGIADIVYKAGAFIPRDTVYLHGDAFGSTSLVTDASGQERERLYYPPFGGRVDIDGNPPTGPPSDIRDGFTGHRHDDELGLIDMRGRIFDTKTSRFPTPDPFIADPTFSPSLNRFAYVHQSPLNWVDPTGFSPDDPYRGMNIWGGSVFGGDATAMPSTGMGVGTVDPGLVQDVATGIAGMHFPAGSDAVNSSGCPTGTGKTPRPCAGASQGGCPSGNAQTDSWSLTNSWGFRFAKGAAIAKVTEVWRRLYFVIDACVRRRGAHPRLAYAAYRGGSALDDGGEKGGVVGCGRRTREAVHPDPRDVRTWARSSTLHTIEVRRSRADRRSVVAGVRSGCWHGGGQSNWRVNGAKTSLFRRVRDKDSEDGRRYAPCAFRSSQQCAAERNEDESSTRRDDGSAWGARSEELIGGCKGPVATRLDVASCS
jgi:RHS repeat-associated protein